MKKTLRLGIAFFSLALLLAGCGYNQLQGLDEEVKAAWAEVQNQYQRRADLIVMSFNGSALGVASHQHSSLQA